MNIASVPCRCGQSCTLRARRAARGRGSAIACTTAGVSSALEAGMPGERRIDDSARLVEVRRAGDVRQDAAGPQGGDRGIQQRGLQSRELGDVRRPLAPAGLRAAAQRTEPGARRVEQDAVERRPGSRSRTAGRRLRAPREPDRTRPARCARAGPRRNELVRDEVAPPSAASAASSAALPPGPGAQVEPALARDDRARPAQGERGELRSLVLHARAPARDRRRCRPDLRRPIAHRPARRLPARRPRRRVARPGSATRLTSGASLSAASSCSSSSALPVGRRATAGTPRTTQSGCAYSTASRASPREPGQRALAPLLGRRARDRAEHAVREALRRPLARRARPGRPTRRRRRAAAMRIDSSWWTPSRSASSTSGSSFSSGRSITSESTRS